jgi:hypothetical protein
MRNASQQGLFDKEQLSEIRRLGVDQGKNAP